MGHRKTRKTPATNEKWRLHDTYQPGPSCNRIVTRSQSAFLRLRNTPSDLDLFSDSSRHHPPKRPCLMETLKGKYGSIPRTIATRSFGKHIGIDFKLLEKIDFYKKYEIKTEIKTTVKERQAQANPNQRQEKYIEKNQERGERKSENKNNDGNKGKKSNDKIRKENQVQEEEMKKKQAVEERRRRKAEEKSKKEEMRKRSEEEENNNKQAEEEEKKRIQAEEEGRKKMQADEEERNIIQAEEEEIKEKRDGEQDDEGNGQCRSGSFFGGRISLKSLSHIFNFGNNNEKNQ